MSSDKRVSVIRSWLSVTVVHTPFKSLDHDQTKLPHHCILFVCKASEPIYTIILTHLNVTSFRTSDHICELYINQLWDTSITTVSAAADRPALRSDSRPPSCTQMLTVSVIKWWPRPANCFLGDKGDVAMFDQEHVQDRYRFCAEVLDVLGRTSFPSLAIA